MPLRDKFASIIYGSRRGWVIIISAIVVVILLLVIGFSTNKNSPANTKAGEYFDKGSGETVSNPPGRTPESFGTTNAQPIYLGFSKLLDIGITSYQLDALKEGFHNYSTSTKKNIKEFSIAVDTIKVGPHDSTGVNPKDSVTFDMTFDRKDKYRAKVDYYNLTIIELFIFDSNDKQVYTSGPIDANEDTYAN